MRRRKQKKISAPVEPAVNGPLGHQPFQALKHFKIVQEKPQETPPVSPPITLEPKEDDLELFQAAMTEVTPLDHDNLRVGLGPRSKPPVPRPPQADDLEVIAHLEELVTGRANFDLTDSDEYLEGHVRGLHPNLLEKLRRGHFSVQAHLDLHGMTVVEADQAVEKFLAEAMALGRRCVLLIHGRGLNSKDHIPVLKQRLAQILLRSPIRRRILAFTSARPHDGGLGASYVLLRANN